MNVHERPENASTDVALSSGTITNGGAATARLDGSRRVLLKAASTKHDSRKPGLKYQRRGSVVAVRRFQARLEHQAEAETPRVVLADCTVVSVAEPCDLSRLRGQTTKLRQWR